MWTFGAACVYDIVRHKRAPELKVRAPARGGELQNTIKSGENRKVSIKIENNSEYNIELIIGALVGFENGNKGYDITVGDQNAQIKGVFTENANNIAPTVGPNGYHFEYTESSSGQIIAIDKYTGKITAKKEGDVDVSAVLKDGEKIISNTYTYSLHVFAKHEGMDWKLEKTYTYS